MDNVTPSSQQNTDKNSTDKTMPLSSFPSSNNSASSFSQKHPASPQVTDNSPETNTPQKQQRPPVPMGNISPSTQKPPPSPPPPRVPVAPPPDLPMSPDNIDAPSVKNTPSPYTPSAISPHAKPSFNMPPLDSEKKRGDSKTSFTPPRVPPMPIPKNPNIGDKSAPASPQDIRIPLKKRKLRGIIILVAIACLVVLAGVLGYFVVVPLLFSSDTPQETLPAVEDVPTIPNFPDTTIPDITIPDVSTDTFPSDDSKNNTDNIEDAPVTKPSPTHASLFSTPADTTINKTIDNINTSVFKSVVGSDVSTQPSLKEIVLSDSYGTPITISELGQSLLPTLFTPSFIKLFEDDFTLALYSDGSVGWPVYIIKASDDADLSVIQSGISDIESLSSPEISNIYLTSIGNSGQWKDGQAEGVTTRYSIFTKSPVALNYGIKGDLLIIGTSYDSFKAVVRRL
jgi:hypothetical protein